MKTYEFENMVFTEMSLHEEYMRVQVTEFDHNKRAHSSLIYFPAERWEQAFKGDEYNRKVIKGAYELLRDNGFAPLMK